MNPSTALSRRTRAILLALAVALPAVPATAATFSVGPGATCTHATLQAALDAAANSPGPDIVKIVRSATWTGIQASTQTDQDVDILGGFLACTSPTPDGKTTLSGAGGQARPVITLRGNGRYRLRNLVIRDGDQAGDDNGGGIHFVGGGIVEISDSEIVENSAEDGGGIYAQGTTTLAELIIGANVIIGSNTARRHGGGVAAHNLEMSMYAPGSMLFMNTAGQRGGGLFIASGDFTAHAYIGSSGVADLGAVYGNQAAIGGGIAVVGGVNSGRLAQVQVFSTNPAVPVRIRGNTASQRGGAIDLQPDAQTYGSGSFANAVAQLRNADLFGNSAPVGAAINLAHDNYGIGYAMGSNVLFNLPYPGRPLHPAAAPCPFGAPCGTIRLNHTNNTTGAVVHLSDDSQFQATRIAIEDNAGGWLMYLAGEDATYLRLDNSLIVRNTTANALIHDDHDTSLSGNMVWIHYLTIADNHIGTDWVMQINEDMAFSRSIVDQPDHRLMGPGGGTHNIGHVIVTHPVNPPAGTTIAAARFVDPARGDYMPRAGARAVDFMPGDSLFPQDMYSHTRRIDLAVNGNEHGTSDAGALEREYLQPIVLNSDFDADLRHWDALAPSSDWDGTQNIAGPADSGSLRATLSQSNARIVVREQCIHLPGPGIYALRGLGKVTAAPPIAPPNRVMIDWELRYAPPGIDGCANGPADLAGSLLLATGNSWAAPIPAEITVAEALFTQNTALTLRAAIQNGSVIAPDASPDTNAPQGGTTTGWFDGIALIIAEPGLDLFADGFESP